MKKNVFILLTLFVLGGCGAATATQEESSTEEATTVSIGVMPSTDNMPLIVAHEQGFDVKHGVSIELESFKSARDRDAAFQAGAVDGINADLVSFSTYLEGGMDIQITSSTYGQFDLVATAENQTISDLQGKDVIILKNQGPEFAVDQLLRQAVMTEADVNLVEVPQVPSRVELLQNQQAAAAILPEPFVTMTKAEGMNNLGSTRDAGINLFVLCFTTEVINEKAEALQGMYEAYNEAVAWMKENDKEAYIQLFIDEIGFPEALKEQIEVPDYPEANQAKREDIEMAFDWAREKGIFTLDLQAEDVLSDVYFK